MGISYIISVYLHILFAAIWIGGMLFLPLVLLPSIKQVSNKIDILYATGIKFRVHGWMSIFGLILTGAYNMYAKGIPFSITYLATDTYGKLLGTKLLLFSCMLTIVTVHDFYIGNKAIDQMRIDNSTKFRIIARWSGRINLMLSLAIAFLGVAISRGGF